MNRLIKQMMMMMGERFQTRRVGEQELKSQATGFWAWTVTGMADQ